MSFKILLLTHLHNSFWKLWNRCLKSFFNLDSGSIKPIPKYTIMDPNALRQFRQQNWSLYITAPPLKLLSTWIQNWRIPLWSKSTCEHFDQSVVCVADVLFVHMQWNHKYSVLDTKYLRLPFSMSDTIWQLLLSINFEVLKINIYSKHNKAEKSPRQTEVFSIQQIILICQAPTPLCKSHWSCERIWVTFWKTKCLLKTSFKGNENEIE